MANCSAGKIKEILVWTLFSLFSCGVTIAQGAPTSSKTLVVFFGQQKSEDFQAKLKPLFLEKARPCAKCEIENYTPYNKDGVVDLSDLNERIESLPAETSFVFFDFNMKVTEQNKDLVQLLNQKAKNGLVIVGTAGAPKQDETSGPLSRTVLGQVESALIIGELGDKDRLMPTGFYGPEMLTALRSPKDLMGQGYSPLFFAASLAEHWQKRTPQEWVEYFRNKKAKSRKIWMTQDDLF